MHASYVPAPPPPPEPPKVLRTVPPPTMAARNGHLAGCPPNPPLLAFPRRGPGSNAGPPAPPAPRAPPTVPSGQPLYCVSRIQPPPPSSAPRQMRTGLLPAPNNATFPGSRRGPPPPPPLTEQETRGGGDPFLSRPSGAAGGRGIRAPDPKRALSQFPFHQAEAMHIAQGAHAAPRDDASLHLSSCRVPAYVRPLHSATDSSPGGVPSQVLQGSSTSSAEFLRHQHGNVDHYCEDSGFASVDITGGPRGISSPQNQPRVLLPPEPRRPTEQVPVVLVLHPKRGDSSDSSKWPSERQPYRDYNADHAFENGGSRRNSTHGSHDSPNRLTHPPEEDRQAFDLLSRDSMPTGFHTMEEGGTFNPPEPQDRRRQRRQSQGQPAASLAPNRSAPLLPFPLPCSVPRMNTNAPSLSSVMPHRRPRPPTHASSRRVARPSSVSPAAGHLPLTLTEAKFSRKRQADSSRSRHTGHSPAHSPHTPTDESRRYFPRSACPRSKWWQSSAQATCSGVSRGRNFMDSPGRAIPDTRRRESVSPDRLRPLAHRKEHLSRLRKCSDSSRGSARASSSRFARDASPSRPESYGSVRHRSSFARPLSRRRRCCTPRRLRVPILLSVPTTSTRRRLSQLSPRRVHSASAADWKSVASSDSPRVSRELSPGSVGTDASRKESALSPAFNSRAQWHPPSQLTPSPCSLSLARLPPSPITPFGVVGHQRSQGIDPSVPTEGRPPEPSPPDASPVQRRSLDGGRGSHAQKRTRDLPGADVPRPLPPAPPVVLNVGGRLSHSQRAFEHEAAKPDSRPRTERQRRRKQRQQQRRQRARRRQQPQQQEPYTEESPQRETPRDSPSACGHTEEEQESFSRGDQAATTTFYPPPFVHRFSNLSDSTDSEQDGERTAEGDREEESDPWAASLEDVERHLKRRKALHSGTGHDFSHFPVGLQWDPRSKPSSDCPMLQNCDELFLPPWREQQRGTSGRVIYQFELLQHRPFRALWNSTAVDVSSSPSPFAQHHAVRSKASSPAHELRSLAHGARSQDSSGEAERTALFQENVGRGAGGRSAALPRDHLDSAYVRSGPIDRGHQRRAGEARGVPSRGPGSSCSNSSRRTSMSLGGDGEQWGGAERTCESDKPETFFWESEKCQRFVMTSSTRAPTEGDGSTDDSGFHHGFSSGKGDERNKQPLRRGSDTGRSPGCHEPQPKCWWGDQTPNAEARRNSLHEKDGGSSMMLPHVPWC
ncbi:hypothetical protein BESB_051590 [Besnoitia besnoiti]|uniref:Uncharacterized protein n=1 Tax=Besnoitia besnoiti TaxID=94643 RepID=A0A2A9MAK5_BESBE|nr:hypothetical protein BESB_051590 [Besnoitia besnoiti]PFH35508.1 hypothetical protein BESB_051590 [Besnoitia besnoiti]